ncbi:ESPR domain-containing protein [Caballeronia zhejiangensis]|uniref:ESPR domain-containing protein n=1 Tax=Caballeronia zhejiangensis TaxID=871203 RepID=UPI001EF47328|nr:ESPR domain-containing protein [Caballeronia zhejiangensis]MCG7402389.1 ESPR domain-containing protein [Caballeronia zhejiangensis]MCI1045112.1 ESPR domain-containing protein [Caballeronia zhejiangensis]
MNKSYRSIWNEKVGTFVAVAETAMARGKKSSGGAVCDLEDGQSAILAASRSYRPYTGSFPSTDPRSRHRRR